MSPFHDVWRLGGGRLWLAGVLAALALSDARAREPGRDERLASSAETVTVQALSPEVIRPEVETLLYKHWSSQINRWDTAFCPLVAGLPEPFQSVVLDHLTRAAHAVIPDLPEHCDTKTVVVLFTDNGSEAFDRILARNPSLGSGYDSRGFAREDLVPPDKRDIAALRQDRPVRWYRSIVTDPAPGVIVGWNGWLQRPILLSYGGGSWLRKETQARTSSTIVIVDLPLAAGPTWRQLADYVAFVVLADSRIGDNFTERSIMSLYNDGHFQNAAPAGLTAFDMALLRALYKADPAQDAHDAQGEITQAITHDLSHPEQAMQ